jgi:chaperonin GroES
MSIRPLSDRILILRAPVVESVGAIVLPEIARVAPAVGRVVATGRGRRTRRGTRVPIVVAPDDVVMFSPLGASTITVAGQELVVVRERDVLAVYELEAPPAPVLHPPVDVVRGAEGVTVLVDLPGVHAASIRAVLMGAMLTVEATRRPPVAPAGAAYVLRERTAGRLSKSIELPGHLVGGDVRATWEAGVLTVRIARNRSRRTHEIPVAAAASATPAPPTTPAPSC